MKVYWIDTVSGTWGPVVSPEGRLVFVLSTPELMTKLELKSDSDIAEFGENRALTWELEDGAAVMRIPMEFFE